MNKRIHDGLVLRKQRRDGPHTALDLLFDEWIESYPPAKQKEFHKDGIVDEESYRRELMHVLFVLLEPNSKGGRYDRFCGRDLREIFGEIGLGKAVDLNIARWTRILLDGVTEFFTPDRHTARQQLRRVAVMNLKKLAGSGTANPEAISVQAWRDGKFIRRQVDIIKPSLVVTCGEGANRLFGWIMADDPFNEVPAESVWNQGAMKVLLANHPSLRPKNARAAFERVVDRASQATIGAFGLQRSQ